MNEAAHAYLLGLYLGDGTGNAVQAGAVVHAAALLGPTLRGDRPIGRYRNVTGRARHGRPSVRLRPRHGDPPRVEPAWPTLLPQHGPGKKHLRPIALEQWQQRITTRFPRSLIRGLIHSDGARCVNRFSTKLPSGRVATYEYPRYFFTNYSADIRDIFCRHCELLGIRWTQSSFKNISVSHRRSVAILDGFVGPKG